MNTLYDFGMIGLGVMGSNLLLNMADQGFAAIGFDLKPERCRALEAAAKPGTVVKGVEQLDTLVQSLKKPRKLMMLVPAGGPVDDVLHSLLPLLEPGDIVIDGGNSYYKDTLRRVNWMNEKSLHFFGMGVSGGELGARLGPSLMPGGDRQAYQYLKPVLEAVAAKANGRPCVDFMGNGAAGHYVKMVHNGIEYALMQLIGEAYDLLHRSAGLTNEQLHNLFKEWNKGPLQSFLVHITANIFQTKDAGSDNFLVDVILDQAGSKGTGKWTSQEALDLPVPIPSIDAAVAARNLSGFKHERKEAAALYGPGRSGQTGADPQFLADLEQALVFGFIMAYAQGLDMLGRASVEQEMEIPLPAVVQVWQAGCIIRSNLLVHFAAAFDRHPELANLLLDGDVAALVQAGEEGVRKTITRAVEARIPVPALMSALAYFDSYRSERLPTNLIQAQRDFFGAHTYQRIDKPGVFHTEWHE
ncbi:NADP-dependent phosphogluconate dehydrogenase [Paraflavisolibacter sp. H34]|uniref:NADP-dependent phosphogluconate dehydrogenase n=1 Tax=Huijunlia imazamoxiresistens TaxID=3127457 RepID=UPI00301B0D93